MFDGEFYRQVLPDRVGQQCQGRKDVVPVVLLHLNNGQVLDLCHIAHTDKEWFSVLYFRDIETCEDMDAAIMPYELVSFITISTAEASKRKLGFALNVGKQLETQ